MNSQTPLSPLHSVSHPSRGKSNVLIAVITIAALHVVFFGGLLLQGCKPETPRGAEQTAALDSEDQYPLDNNSLPPPTTPAFDSWTTGIVDTAELPEGTGAPEDWPVPETAIPLPDIEGEFLSGQDTGIDPADTEGTILALLATESQFEEYKIQAGDYPYKIAREKGITLRALMDANPGLDARRLQIGQIIQVPFPVASANASADGGSPMSIDAIDSGEIYTVQPGDNLTKIARKYPGVSVRQIRDFNGLRTDRIMPNQKLRIPSAQ